MSYLLRQGNLLLGDPPTLLRADLLIEGDRISAIGDHVVPANPTEAIAIDCQNYLITPGFINAHIHPNQLLNRGFLEGLSTDGLLAGMHGRHEVKSDDDRYWASLVSVAEGLRCGTTYFAAFASESGRIGDALNAAGVRGTLTVAPKDQWFGTGPTPVVKDTDQVLSRLAEYASQKGTPLVTHSIGAASEKAASAGLLKGISQIAKATGTRVFMHVAEGLSAVSISRRLHGVEPISYLNRIDFLGPHVSLVHACNITDEEIQFLATTSTRVCHCPISNAKTVAGILPLRKLFDAGVKIGLGTDAASTGNTNNIIVEGYFCSLLHRAVTESSDWPSAAAIYRLLTLDGAAAVGLQDEVGQLAPGFKADLAMWDLRQTAFLTNLFDPVTALVFAASELTTTTVFVDGKMVFNERPILFDLEYASRHVRSYYEGLATTT